MQIVAIGFIIGVIQDSAETALNSSTDVVFSAAASHHLSKYTSNVEVLVTRSSGEFHDKKPSVIRLRNTLYYSYSSP